MEENKIDNNVKIVIQNDTPDINNNLEKLMRQKSYYYTHSENNNIDISGLETNRNTDAQEQSHIIPQPPPRQSLHSAILKKRYIENIEDIDTSYRKYTEDDSKSFVSDGLGSEPSDSGTENDLYDEMERENSDEISPGIYEIDYETIHKNKPDENNSAT